MSFIYELKRRNVFRVAAAYIVMAWLVVQVVETILPAFGFGDDAVRIAVVLCASGFLPAMMFAWVFELTPDGLKKERDIAPSDSITAHTGKRLDRLIIAALAVAVGYFLFDKMVLSEQREAVIAESARQEGMTTALIESYDGKSIVVLPFVDLSVSQDQEYLSHGLSDQLLDQLARVPGLRVISRTSAFSFQDEGLEVGEIAERFKVAHILEGSVRTDVDQIRVSARLIEARIDTQLWSQTYDRSMGNVFALQDEIAAAVVDQLKVSLIEDGPPEYEPDPEAQRLTLQADHFIERLTEEGMAKAINLYKAALDIDAGFADAWRGLSIAYDRMAGLHYMPQDQAAALSDHAAGKAIALDPDSDRTHEMLAWRALRQENKLQKAADHYRRAMELNPTAAGLRGNVGLFLGELDRQAEARKMMEYHVSRDPANWVGYNNLGILYRHMMLLDEAQRAFETALAFAPDSGGVHYELGLSLYLADDLEGAMAAFEKEPVSVFQDLGLAVVHHALGNSLESDALIENVLAQWGDQVSFYIAQVAVVRGELGRAFELLDRARENSEPELVTAVTEPMLAGLHGDTRWATFRESLGRSKAQLDAVDFPVILPSEGL